MPKKACKNPRETLLAVTIRLLRHRDKTLTLRNVADGAGCTTSFLSSLLSSDPPQHPSVNAIQNLYEFLKNEPLNY